MDWRLGDVMTVVRFCNVLSAPLHARRLPLATCILVGGLFLNMFDFTIRFVNLEDFSMYLPMCSSIFPLEPSAVSSPAIASVNLFLHALLCSALASPPLNLDTHICTSIYIHAAQAILRIVMFVKVMLLDVESPRAGITFYWPLTLNGVGGNLLSLATLPSTRYLPTSY